MPLDAESQALLDARKQAAIPDTARQSLQDVRGSREQWRTRTPDPIVAIAEVFERTIPVEGGSIGVRVYRQKKAHDSPAIIYLHGGGWVLGNLDHSDGLCRWLASKADWTILNVDYRLAPEHRYPTAVEDTYRALCWTAENAKDLGINPERLAIAGSSAGGNLAAAAALMSRDRRRPRVRAQLLAYPALDDACTSASFREFAEGYIVAASDMQWYWTQYLGSPDDAKNPYACPLKAPDLSALPPALIITAECDPLRDDGERYAAKLREAGVDVRASRYPGTLHGFFAMPGTLSKAALAIDEAVGFLKTHLWP